MTDAVGTFLEGSPAVFVAATVLVLAVAGVWLVGRALATAGEGFSINWQVGGFGTPARGWRMSGPLTQLLAGLALAALAAVVAPVVGSLSAEKTRAAAGRPSTPALPAESRPSAPPAEALAPASAVTR